VRRAVVRLNSEVARRRTSRVARSCDLVVSLLSASAADSTHASAEVQAPCRGAGLASPHAMVSPSFVVVTGGPGAGKTTVLDICRRQLHGQAVVLPESASLLYRGGFPRRTSLPCRRAAQRAIFHVQRELENLAREEAPAPLVLCDRGTLDGLAVWPGTREEFEQATGTTVADELARYAAVVHLRTPAEGRGYNHVNPLRIETPAEAARIDARLLEIWADHSRRTVIDCADDFVAKLESALAVVRQELRPPA
jgi:predicted ATPase